MTSILKVSSIQDPTNSNTALTIGTNGLIQPKQVAFQVTGTDLDQSISASTDTTIQFDASPALDTGGYWDAGNHRYTPQVAGWYFFSGLIRMRLNNINSVLQLVTSKNGTVNGSDALRLQFQFDADRLNNGAYPLPSGMFHLNGSTDYVEVFVNTEEAATASDTANTVSLFSGFLVHAT